MAGATTREFDVADHLNTPEETAAYLDAVLEEGGDVYLHRSSAARAHGPRNAGFCKSLLLLVALRTIVKSKGFTTVAQGAGLRRETLYQSFSEDGNPRLSTLSGVLGQLGMRLSVTPQAKRA